MSDGQSAAGAVAASQAQTQAQQTSSLTNGLAGVTAGAQSISGMVGAWSIWRAGKYNGKVAQLNAEVADLQARDALRRGKDAAERQRQTGKRIIGAQRAAFAGQNVAVDQDVAADVVADTERAIAQDVETLKLNATLEAWGMRASAVDSRARGEIAEMEARDRAVGTLLTSTAGAADTYRSLTR